MEPSSNSAFSSGARAEARANAKENDSKSSCTDMSLSKQEGTGHSEACPALVASDKRCVRRGGNILKSSHSLENIDCMQEYTNRMYTHIYSPLTYPERRSARTRLQSGARKSQAESHVDDSTPLVGEIEL